MSATLRNLLVIGLVILAVAGLTIITQFSTSPPAQVGGDAGGPGGTGEGGTAGGLPLVFRDAEMLYDSGAESIAHRSFPGFFEIGDQVHWVSFWFRNPHPYPVRLAMRERSCTSCTSAKVAVVPFEFLRNYTGFAMAAGLPWSFAPLPDLLSPVGYAVNQNALAWHYFDFDKRDDVFNVPAADADRPAVGILALGFLAKAAGPPKPIDAVAEFMGPDEKPYQHRFTVTYAPREAFDLYPIQYPVGDLPEGAAPRTFDVFVYSTTRKPGELPPPVGVVGNNDPFVTLGRPVPMTPAEVTYLVQRAFEETKTALRVESGYRVPVTVHRDVPGKLPDVGVFEKTVHFSVPVSAHTVTTTIKGRVTGLVKLEDGEKIDLGIYNSDYTTKKSFRLYTDRKDLELELDPVQSSPTFVKYELEPEASEGARKYWAIKVTIPAKQGRKPAWDGVVFLKAKSPDGSKANIRLPVTGSGLGR